jgi:hypothetical protein
MASLTQRDGRKWSHLGGAFLQAFVANKPARAKLFYSVAPLHSILELYATFSSAL